jgi:hypothetical protein
MALDREHPPRRESASADRDDLLTKVPSSRCHSTQAEQAWCHSAACGDRIAAW